MQSFKICLALVVLSCVVGCNKANTAPPDDQASTWQANPQSSKYVADMKKYYKGAQPANAPASTENAPDYAAMARKAHGGH